MPGSVAAEVIGRQKWLDPIAKTIQSGVETVYEKSGDAGLQVKDALHGVWLGHPLHAAITDVPLGAWTTAVLIDALETATGREELRAGADAAVGIGLIGAVGAAVTGLTDYQHVSGTARRVGFAHAALNILTTGCFTASYVARKRGSRGAGKLWSFIGMGIGSVAAKLGGDLVYDYKLGVDHTEKGAYPAEFTPVMRHSDIMDGETKRVEVNGTPLLIAKRGENIFAIAETCTHLGGPLSQGEITASTVTCPWHGSTFALDDGRVLNGPAVHNQPCMDVRVSGDQIEIRRHLSAPERRGPKREAA